MKRWIAWILCAVLLVSLAACGSSGAENPTTEPETTGSAYPQIAERLSWDKINALPIKNSAMTVAQMRQLCVDFMRLSKTALWTPDEEYTFIKTNKGAMETLEVGQVYGGMPYVGNNGSGNIYRMMDYYDPETGVLQVKRAGSPVRLFGNHCSGTVYWAWGRVINSFDYGSTMYLTHAHGFLRLGPYTYDEEQNIFGEETGTRSICEANGKEIMFQSYALLQKADGIVLNNGSGHVVMCAEDAHVEYTSDGKIDGEKSYVIILEQNSAWSEKQNGSGDKYLMKNSVDTQWSFETLYKKSYLPFTFAEFLGTDPVEETVCTVTATADTITVDELFNITVNANYGISDVYAVVKNAQGEEVYRHVERASELDARGVRLKKKSSYSDSWGTLDVSNGEFTVEIFCQLSTGERPTVYTGKLIPAKIMP